LFVNSSAEQIEYAAAAATKQAIQTNLGIFGRKMNGGDVDHLFYLAIFFSDILELPASAAQRAIVLVVVWFMVLVPKLNTTTESKEDRCTISSLADSVCVGGGKCSITIVDQLGRTKKGWLWLKQMSARVA